MVCWSVSVYLTRQESFTSFDEWYHFYSLKRGKRIQSLYNSHPFPSNPFFYFHFNFFFTFTYRPRAMPISLPPVNVIKRKNFPAPASLSHHLCLLESSRDRQTFFFFFFAVLLPVLYVIPCYEHTRLLCVWLFT